MEIGTSTLDLLREIRLLNSQGFSSHMLFDENSKREELLCEVARLIYIREECLKRQCGREQDTFVDTLALIMSTTAHRGVDNVVQNTSEPLEHNKEVYKNLVDGMILDISNKYKKNETPSSDEDKAKMAFIMMAALSAFIPIVDQQK